MSLVWRFAAADYSRPLIVASAGGMNQLAGQSSPYLLQHADNPVQWFPWSDEALALARERDVPILLSIGYSACHWCHVMAHECFEDEGIAQVMNAHFVNIKVDREERPDLDKIYQNAHFLLAQRGGGWPLTVFLTPDSHAPFFAGTYFPPSPRHGLPAFADLCQRVSAFFRDNRAEVDAQNQRLFSALQQMDGVPASDAERDLNDAPLALFVEGLSRGFDERFGGFGQAPKFPHPAQLERLLRSWAREPASARGELGLTMVNRSLERMARGGLFDQLGGGFFRYSVDAQWQIPHFEKMLYDNGPLLALYAQAFAATGQRLFRDVCLETAAFVSEELQSHEGGYFSALDADSEGEEGRYYVWSLDELRSLVDADDWPAFALRYGLDEKPNFEGRFHLCVRFEMEAIAQRLNAKLETVGAALGRAHEALFDARDARVRPGRDEKVLVAWNGLMVRGMAVAGRHLNDARFIQSARAAIDFLHTNLWRDGRLLAVFAAGQGRLNAYLDDYAFLLDGLLEYLQCDWDSGLLQWACELADVLLTHFEDEDGGFFFTSDDHEALIHRLKSFSDEAIPNGNAVAVRALLRLSALTGELRFAEAAERALRCAWPLMADGQQGLASLLSSLEAWLEPEQLWILRGEPEAMASWQERAQRAFAPRRAVFAIAADETDLPPSLALRSPRGEVAAYVCEGQRCLPPIEDFEAFRQALGDGECVAT